MFRVVSWLAKRRRRRDGLAEIIKRDHKSSIDRRQGFAREGNIKEGVKSHRGLGDNQEGKGENKHKNNNSDHTTTRGRDEKVGLSGSSVCCVFGSSNKLTNKMKIFKIKWVKKMEGPPNDL